MDVLLIVLWVVWFLVCFVFFVFWPRRKQPTTVVEIPYGPNDLLVIEAATRMSREQVQRLQVQIERSLESGAKVMVLDHGLTAKVLKR